MRQYKFPVPLALNTERTFTVDGDQVKGFPGPADFPTLARLEVDDEHDRLEIAFGYVDWNDEPTNLEERKGATVVVGKKSGRVFSIAAKMPDDPTARTRLLRLPLKAMRKEASKAEPWTRPARKVFHYEALHDLVPFILEGERNAIAS